MPAASLTLRTVLHTMEQLLQMERVLSMDLLMKPSGMRLLLEKKTREWLLMNTFITLFWESRQEFMTWEE